MTDKSTFDAIGASSEKLLNRVQDNIELCQRFMGFVALCGMECEKRGVPMDGIQISAMTMRGRTMRAKVKFSKLSLQRSAVPETKAAKDFVSFLAKEAQGLYLLIRKNPDFITYLHSLVEEMEGYCKWHHKQFGDLKFASGFMDENDYIVMEIEQ